MVTGATTVALVSAGALVTLAQVPLAPLELLEQLPAVIVAIVGARPVLGVRARGAELTQDALVVAAVAALPVVVVVAALLVVVVTRSCLAELVERRERTVRPAGPTSAVVCLLLPARTEQQHAESQRRAGADPSHGKHPVSIRLGTCSTRLPSARRQVSRNTRCDFSATKSNRICKGRRFRDNERPTAPVGQTSAAAGRGWLWKTVVTQPSTTTVPVDRSQSHVARRRALSGRRRV